METFTCVTFWKLLCPFYKITYVFRPKLNKYELINPNKKTCFTELGISAKVVPDLFLCFWFLFLKVYLISQAFFFWLRVPGLTIACLGSERLIGWVLGLSFSSSESFSSKRNDSIWTLVFLSLTLLFLFFVCVAPSSKKQNQSKITWITAASMLCSCFPLSSMEPPPHLWHHQKRLTGLVFVYPGFGLVWFCYYFFFLDKLVEDLLTYNFFKLNKMITFFCVTLCLKRG